LKKVSFDQIIKAFSTPKRITITSHYNPDGDAIGSSLAVYHIMKALGHQVNVVIPNTCPDFLKWMPGSSEILLFESEESKVAEIAINEAEFIFCLDYNALHRTGKKMEGALNTAPGRKILIDHHPGPEIKSFDYTCSEISASSTAELVFRFIDKAGYTKFLNRQVAECLYTGIITDTGSFSHSCNSPETYRIVARLVEKGIDAQKLHKLIYDNFSEDRIRLLGYAISEKLTVLPEFNTAYIILTKEVLSKFNYQVGDTEGIVNYPLSIKHINLAVLITERDDLIRLSFRSKGDFPANEIARKYFKGGGHRNAAGGDSFQSVEETVAKLKEILPEYQHKLDFIIS